MKALITLFFLVSTSVYSQKVDPCISVVSENRDTLYLADTDIGYTIKEVWEKFYSEDRPIIIMKGKTWILKESNKRNKSAAIRQKHP